MRLAIGAGNEIGIFYIWTTGRPPFALTKEEYLRLVRYNKDFSDAVRYTSGNFFYLQKFQLLIAISKWDMEKFTARGNIDIHSLFLSIVQLLTWCKNKLEKLRRCESQVSFK